MREGEGPERRGLDGPFILSLPAYAQRGDIAKAAAAREEVLRRVPGYTISILRSKEYSD